jgi:hypothetical protein
MEGLAVLLGLLASRKSNTEVDVPIRGTAPSITSLGIQAELPGSGDRDNHPNSSTSPVRPHHPNASVDSLQQPHDGNSMLPPSNVGAGLGVLSGAGSAVVEVSSTRAKLNLLRK